MTNGEADNGQIFKTLRDLVEWVGGTSRLNGIDPLDVRLELACDKRDISLAFCRGLVLRLGPSESSIRADNLNLELMAKEAHYAIDRILAAKGRP